MTKITLKEDDLYQIIIDLISFPKTFSMNYIDKKIEIELVPKESSIISAATIQEKLRSYLSSKERMTYNKDVLATFDNYDSLEIKMARILTQNKGD